MLISKLAKIAAAASLAFSLAACSSAQPDSSSQTQETQEEKISVLVPAGAPALGMMGAFDQENIDVEVVEGTDVLSAELAKSDSEYDVIVAPVNLGAKIYSNAKTYQLDGVLTWGNLYIVGPEGSDLAGLEGAFAAFGQEAVPGLVLKTVQPALFEKAEWYASVAEAQQALIASRAEYALLAQPAAAAAIAKGKDQGLNLAVIGDLQTMWQEKENTDEKGYPQAAVFVKDTDISKADAVMEKVNAFLKDADSQTIEKKVDEIGAEKLGVPNAKLAASTWNAQNIHYEDAKTADSAVETFLKIFGLEVPEGFYLNS